MIRDTITYAGVDYPVRRVSGYMFATDELNEALGDFENYSEEAEYIDEQIAYYLTQEQFSILSDKECFLLCYDDLEDYEEDNF